MTANKSVYQNFVSTLVASGRSPEIPESADVNGWLVGSWELDVLHYKTVELSSRNIKGEVHFCWVLEGRAIQDVGSCLDWPIVKRKEIGPTTCTGPH